MTPLNAAGVEAVAKAMFDARWPTGSWFSIVPAEKTHYMHMAEAAIQAYEASRGNGGDYPAVDSDGKSVQ